MGKKKTSKVGYKVGSLYAGIGGICRGFLNAGKATDTDVQILWANEYDQHACTTYRRNYEHQLYDCDVHKLYPAAGTPVNGEEIPTPYVDILTSGFPCQAFSVAGYRKGFEDERGLHFFQTMKFLDVPDEKKPKAFLFENVKNFKTHDQGRTYKVIQEEIAKRNYSLITLIFNTMDYANVPQNRERVYMVGFKDEAGWIEGDGSCTAYFDRHRPKKRALKKKINKILADKADQKYYYNRFDCYKYLKSQVKRQDTVYQWRRVYVRENKSNVCPTLTANMGTGGHNVPIIKDSYGIRKLTPRECAKFQGFRNNELKFPPNMADSHLYKQIGNSVSVPMITAIASIMLQALQYEIQNRCGKEFTVVS